ncbi:MAG: NADH-quinone oxidoreductase subunit K [Spirochaetia bacterium]|jgi:multisubunit Na+/H+ antiporter MnhC subunit|nr:NADH-quinone oxidoreductase subunit K [Spirochaetia bacterium]
MDFGQIAVSVGFLLILIGVWGILTQKNIIKIVIGFSVFDTGLHMIMVGIGYVKGGTAPILDGAIAPGTAPINIVAGIVDPVPQALVLTAIVIGLGVTALMLAYVVRLYEDRKSLDISSYEDLKW